MSYILIPTISTMPCSKEVQGVIAGALVALSLSGCSIDLGPKVNTTLAPGCIAAEDIGRPNPIMVQQLPKPYLDEDPNNPTYEPNLKSEIANALESGGFERTVSNGHVPHHDIILYNSDNGSVTYIEIKDPENNEVFYGKFVTNGGRLILYHQGFISRQSCVQLKITETDTNNTAVNVIYSTLLITKKEHPYGVGFEENFEDTGYSGSYQRPQLLQVRITGNPTRRNNYEPFSIGFR